MVDHHDLRTRHHDPRAPTGRVPTDRATPAGSTEGSSDRGLDPGDSHDKGERSLCVGEAA
ncbi:MAG TPA: hypothetical protein VMV06_08555 [Acidimicrobiales bacterium]|nr:hypothetical protein [Acidimicrobiales bacterium]HVB93992.1 hypothetical protein [Acidimicrobiales bacterium]